MRRTITFWLGFGFLGVMIALMFIPPSVSVYRYGDSPGSVTCGSVIGVGWPDSDRLDRDTTSGVTDMDSDLDGAEAARICDHRRTALVALTVLLAVPATALLVIGLIPDRAWPARRPPDDSADASTSSEVDPPGTPAPDSA